MERAYNHFPEDVSFDYETFENLISSQTVCSHVPRQSALVDDFDEVVLFISGGENRSVSAPNKDDLFDDGGEDS